MPRCIPGLGGEPESSIETEGGIEVVAGRTNGVYVDLPTGESAFLPDGEIERIVRERAGD